MKVIVALIGFVGLFSCKQPKVVGIQQMSYIMADMHLADAYASLAYQSDTLGVKNNLNKNLDTLQAQYAVIFANYHLTETSFFANLNYYKAQPFLWDSLYGLVQKRLTNMKPKEIH